MLKAAVDDGPQDLGLEEEVPEAGAVDGDVGALDGVLLGCRGAVTGPVGAIGGVVAVGGLGRVLLFVVQKLSVDVVLGHFDALCAVGTEIRDETMFSW